MIKIQVPVGDPKHRILLDCRSVMLLLKHACVLQTTLYDNLQIGNKCNYIVLLYV